MMRYQSFGQVAFLLLCGRSFGQAAQRWPSRSPGPRQRDAQIRAGGSVAARGTGHGRKSLFSAFSVGRGTVGDHPPSSSRGNPAAGLVGGTAGEASPPLRSSLAMLPIIAADLGLRELFHRLGWSFPSSFAGMMALFAGLVGLDRVAPPYAERAVRLLEPGSTQLMAWLPVVFVPAIIPWIRLPIAGLLGSSSSLPETVVAAAKLGGALGDYSPLPSPPGTARLRVVGNAAKLMLAVAGGWLWSLGSAAAIFTALSPPLPPAPTSSSSFALFPTARTSAPPSLRAAKTGAVGSATAGFFSRRLVRWLGVGMVAAGALSAASFASLDNVAFWPSFFETFRFPLTSFEKWLLGFLVLMIPGVYGAVLSIGLASLFGFAAGRLGVSPGGTPARSCPAWMTVLLPLATSAAATLAAGWTMRSAALGVFDLHDAPELASIMIGNGDLLFYSLGPAVFSFAAPLFRMRGLIFSNARQMVGGPVACASTALFGVALASRLLGIPKAFKVALQAESEAEAKKMPVSALGKALRFLSSPWRKHKAQPRGRTVAAALHAYASPAVAGVLVLTGVLGATFGARILDAFGAKDGVIRGLVQGGPLNVLGMAAISEQEEIRRNGCAIDTAATEASLTRDASTAAMVLTGAAVAVLVSISPVRWVLVSIALGTSVAGTAVP